MADVNDVSRGFSVELTGMVSSCLNGPLAVGVFTGSPTACTLVARPLLGPGGGTDPCTVAHCMS